MEREHDRTTAPDVPVSQREPAAHRTPIREYCSPRSSTISTISSPRSLRSWRNCKLRRSARRGSSDASTQQYSARSAPKHWHDSCSILPPPRNSSPRRWISASFWSPWSRSWRACCLPVSSFGSMLPTIFAPAFIDRQLWSGRYSIWYSMLEMRCRTAGRSSLQRRSIDSPVASAGSREPMIRLSVVDTGIGMSRATLRSAGVPYFSTKSHGTGLGLAMVSQLMESQGGRLSITSTPYHGTAIDLWLPVIPSSVAGSR